MIKEVQWEENKFDVEIITDSKIENFNFDQTSKSISFEVNEENKYVTISMSEELLGGPYVILLDAEKIQYSKSEIDGYVTLSMKPETTGEITIIGTTVIPEFSMFIPLIMGFLIILTVPFVKKINLH
jgi:predicted PilT family ATPase